MITAAALDGIEKPAVDLFAALEGAYDALAVLADNTEVADTPEKRSLTSAECASSEPR